MRNSSLVEWCCAENLAGLKPVTEAMASWFYQEGEGSVLLAVKVYGNIGWSEEK